MWHFIVYHFNNLLYLLFIRIVPGRSLIGFLPLFALTIHPKQTVLKPLFLNLLLKISFNLKHFCTKSYTCRSVFCNWICSNFALFIALSSSKSVAFKFKAEGDESEKNADSVALRFVGFGGLKNYFII
jgi:hypothetical protein